MKTLVMEILQFETGNHKKTAKLISEITNMKFNYEQFMNHVTSVNKQPVRCQGLPFVPNNSSWNCIAPHPLV